MTGRTHRSPTLALYSIPQLIAELQRRGVTGEIYLPGAAAPAEVEEKPAPARAAHRAVNPTDLGNPAVERHPTRALELQPEDEEKETDA